MRDYLYIDIDLVAALVTDTSETDERSDFPRQLGGMPVSSHLLTKSIHESLRHASSDYGRTPRGSKSRFIGTSRRISLGQCLGEKSLARTLHIKELTEQPLIAPIAWWVRSWPIPSTPS